MSRLATSGALLAAMIVVAAVTWGVAAQVMRSPADVAAEAEPPVAGPVTAPVEERRLEADVIVRGTVRYDEPVAVSLRGTPAVDGQPVVTRVPEPDDEVGDGSVLLEVSGRPVFALEGALPAYRDLRPGSSGDDVAQLQEALDRLGHGPGDVDGVFGAATQAALTAWYDDAGYEAPQPSAEEIERLQQAEQATVEARDLLRQAEAQLAQARQGPRRSEVLQAESRVSDAREQLEAAEEGTSEERRARDELAIAEAMLDELREGPDTAAQQQAMADARAEAAAADERLAETRGEVGVWLPAGEIVYLPELPQRVEDVGVVLGDDASGALLTVTSAEVVIESSVAAEDAGLVAEGDDVWIGEAGAELPGAVVEVAARPGTDGAAEDRHLVLVVPHELDEDLLGTSVRIRIPVESTDGDVLAVPLAAVSAGADGSSRVEVLDLSGGGSDSGESSTRLVQVEPGLTADGLVEVRPADGGLSAGDEVVVGRTGAELTDGDGG